MITFPYTVAPGEAASRPLVDVSIDGLDYSVPGLVDTGAVNTIFPVWVAQDAGIDLADIADRPLSVGGAPTSARAAVVTLNVQDFHWETEVLFAHPWTPYFSLMGHHAFLRFFTVIFRAADEEFDLDFIDS